MRTSEKSRSGLKKALYYFISVCAVLFVCLFILIYFLVRSPSFSDRIEKIINARSEMPVEIGSVSLTAGGRLAIKDLVLKESETAGPVIVVPYVEIRINPFSLLKKSVDKITIRKPKLFITLHKRDEKLKTKTGKPSFPFSIKKILIEDGEVTVQNKEGEIFRLSGLDLTFLETSGGKAEISGGGSFYHPVFKEEEQVIVFQGLIDIEEFEFDITKASLSSRVAGVTDIRGQLGLFPLRMRVETTTSNIDLKKTGQIFAGLLDEKGIAVDGTGSLRSAVSIVSPEGAGPEVSATVNADIKNGGFSSSDGSMAGEGISINLSGDFRYLTQNSTAEFSIDTRASGFELLAGSFYGDFSSRDLTSSIHGKYNMDDGLLRITDSDLGISDIGTLRMSGKISSLTESPTLDAELDMAGLTNSRAYDFFIRETFQERFPFLSRLELTGTTSLALAVKGTRERFHVNGKIDISDTDILDKDSGMSVKGINLVLPVDVSYPEVSEVGDIEHFGSLIVKSVSKDDFHISELKAFPAVWQNSLVFKEDISVPVFGGKVRFENVSYSQLFSPKRKLALSVYLDNISLDQLSSVLKLPEFSGTLTGVIPKASLAGSSFNTDGTITMELFGGTMDMSGLAINNVFGPVPSIKASIEIREIDLGKLTDTFEFGHISGILQGHVKDLVIAQGQAQGFDARIETVKRRGIDQEISVEALNKISILGSGASASVLSQGIYKMFKLYRYSKIGFKGKLKNDKFLLTGIESEGGRDYLVKGGLLPPKVNVISYTRKVSFQEMVKRLNRIREMDSTDDIIVE